MEDRPKVSYPTVRHLGYGNAVKKVTWEEDTWARLPCVVWGKQGAERNLGQDKLDHRMNIRARGVLFCVTERTGTVRSSLPAVTRECRGEHGLSLWGASGVE